MRLTAKQRKWVIAFLNTKDGEKFLVDLLGPMIDKSIKDASKTFNVEKDSADWWKWK
jgi:hypothetical protein